MNFRQIEIFKAVMETGTVTGAARRLHISQPAVSKMLGQLERDLGFAAFDRLKGRLVPTAEARSLYGQIERAYLGMDYLTRFATDLRELRRGHLVVSVLPTLSVNWMPAIVARFLRDHPGITLSLLTRTSAKVMEWVAEQQVDLGIAMLTADDPMIEHELLWDCEAVCILPAGHELAKKTVIEAHDLQDQPFISLSSTDNSRRNVDRVLEAEDVRVRVVVDTILSATACGLVAEGVGISIVDPMTAAHYANSGIVARRFKPRVTFDFQLLRPLHRPRAQVVDHFIDYLKQAVPEAVNADKVASLPA